VTHGQCVIYINIDVVRVVVDRMQDMAEQISKLTESQQLYQDAVSLKERELSVCALIMYEIARN